MVSSKSTTVQDYLAGLPAERRDVVARVRDLVNANLPDGYVEAMNWGMISWEIPLSRYPATYNGQPLAYVALAAQKNAYSLYLMAADDASNGTAMLKKAYADAGRKLDMGKCCLRFRKFEDLLVEPIARLVADAPVDAFIARYEASRRK